MKGIALVLLLIPTLVSAQNLVRNGDAESKTDNWSASVETSADGPHSGKSCFKMLAGNATSAELIAVDPAAEYELSGWFRSADDRTANLYLGLMPFDADKKPIQCQQVGAIAVHRDGAGRGLRKGRHRNHPQARRPLETERRLLHRVRGGWLGRVQ